jgi:S-adenosylmethionine/arginine decarboxylase-like enzyme
MSKGRHLILDLYDCDPGILDDYDELTRLLEGRLKDGGSYHPSQSIGGKI